MLQLEHAGIGIDGIDEGNITIYKSLYSKKIKHGIAVIQNMRRQLWLIIALSIYEQGVPAAFQMDTALGSRPHRTYFRSHLSAQILGGSCAINYYSSIKAYGVSIYKS
jgi:hypothetical protein